MIELHQKKFDQLKWKKKFTLTTKPIVFSIFSNKVIILIVIVIWFIGKEISIFLIANIFQILFHLLLGYFERINVFCNQLYKYFYRFIK